MNAIQTRRFSTLSFVLLIFITLATLFPALISLVLSVKDYNLARGFIDSPSVGLRNFAEVLQSPYFIRLLINSLMLWLVSLSGSLLLALPIAWFGSQIQSKTTLATLAGLLLIPAFIPASAYFTLMLKVFSSRLFVQGNLYYLGFAAQTILPGAALIAFAGIVVGYLYRSARKDSLTGASMGCLTAALLFAFQSLSPAYEASLLSANPLVYDVADNLNLQAYRTGLMQAQISSGAASYVIRSVLQLLLAVIPVTLTIILLKKQDRLRPEPAAEIKAGSSGAKAAWFVALALAVLFLFTAGIPTVGRISDVLPQLFSSVIVTLLSVIVGLAVSWLLLFGAAGSGHAAVTVAAALVLGCGNAIVAQYLLAHQAGLVNTVLATPLTQWLQPPVLLLLFLFALVIRMNRSQTTILLMAGAAALFIGAQAYGGFMPQLIFASNAQLFTMGVAYRNVISGPAGGDSGLQALYFLFNVLPCLISGFGAAWLVRLGLIKSV